MTKVFISYSHVDESYRKELEKHLSSFKRNGYINTWTDREIIPGNEWQNVISKELDEAKIILLLISSDFLASDYCYEIEMKTALQKHDKGEAIVIPIILRFCDWKDTPFSKLQGLPLEGKPIKYWNDVDEAFLHVVQGIKTAVNAIAHNSSKPFDVTSGSTPEEQLATIRKNVLSAGNERDLRKSLFDLTEFKKANPLNFEIVELERTIQQGIKFEERHMKTECEMPAESPKRRVSSLFYILLVLGIILIIYLVIHFL